MAAPFFEEEGAMLNVLYEDDALIVVEKPAGATAQAAGAFSKDMVSEIKNYLVKKNRGKEPYVGVVHRLDKPVSGVMVYAKTKEAAAVLSRQVQAEEAERDSRRMEKLYYALVCGRPDREKGILEDILYFDRKTNTSYVVEKNGTGKRALLEYEVIAMDSFSGFAKNTERLRKSDSFQYEGDLTLLRVRLHTGRHHQIRVQLSNTGLPILGDTKYNPYMKDYRGLSALCLCAYELSFTHPVTGARMTFHVGDKF